MVSVRSERPICASPRLSAVSTTLPLKQFQCCLIDGGRLSSFRGRSSNASSFHAFLLQAIDGVMPLALCPQVVSQSPQHFRSSEKQATCEGCFACQSICSVVSLHSGLFRAQHPQEFSKVDVDGRRPLTHSSLAFPFHFSLFIASSSNLEDDGMSSPTATS